MDKRFIPIRLWVSVEEQLEEPPQRRWLAQFRFDPHGWFRGVGCTPDRALGVCWTEFKLKVKVPG